MNDTHLLCINIIILRMSCANKHSVGRVCRECKRSVPFMWVRSIAVAEKVGTQQQDIAFFFFCQHGIEKAAHCCREETLIKQMGRQARKEKRLVPLDFRQRRNGNRDFEELFGRLMPSSIISDNGQKRTHLCKPVVCSWLEALNHCQILVLYQCPPHVKSVYGSIICDQ